MGNASSSVICLAGALVIGGLGLGLWAFGIIPGAVNDTIIKAAQMTDATSPDKLGWLDRADMTDADWRRLVELRGGGLPDGLMAIRAIQSGARSGITRRDFELLRQDRRRAQAAYPDVASDDLYQGTWLNVDLSARVPGDFCRGNSNGTKVGDIWYLDGPCHVSVVRPQYPKRASAGETTIVLSALNDAKQQKQLKRITKWGYSSSWGGTGGSVSINAYPDPLPSSEEEDDRHVPGQAVIIIDRKIKYQFPFNPSDWIDQSSNKDALVKLADSRGATATEYVAPPSKPWVIKDGSLARGETVQAGRLGRSMWNGDGYDNTDIGPDTPESWVLGTFMGMPVHYVPAPENGDRRSDPAKPWYVIASYYGYSSQISGGWTEEEAKAALPKLATGQTIPMQGQDYASLNRGNLREARATQVPSSDGIVLKDRTVPVAPAKEPDTSVPYHPGMTLAPGQSTRVGF